MAREQGQVFNFENGYSPARFRVSLLRAFLYAAASVLAIYVVLPFTQLISGFKKEVIEYREFNVSPPPPPPPPEMDEPPPPEPEEEPPPELREPPPPLDLAQLEMALNPGIGDAQAAGLGFGGFEAQPDALADLQLFDVQDLDEPPKAINRVAISVPHSFRRERRSGQVRLEIQIDERGRTTVLRVLTSSDSQLEGPAAEAAEKWTWTPPKKNGEAVRARYILPLGFKF